MTRRLCPAGVQSVWGATALCSFWAEFPLDRMANHLLGLGDKETRIRKEKEKTNGTPLTRARILLH